MCIYYRVVIVCNAELSNWTTAAEKIYTCLLRIACGVSATRRMLWNVPSFHNSRFCFALKHWLDWSGQWPLRACRQPEKRNLGKRICFVSRSKVVLDGRQRKCSTLTPKIVSQPKRTLSRLSRSLRFCPKYLAPAHLPVWLDFRCQFYYHPGAVGERWGGLLVKDHWLARFPQGEQLLAAPAVLRTLYGSL